MARFVLANLVDRMNLHIDPEPTPEIRWWQAILIGLAPSALIVAIRSGVTQLGPASSEGGRIVRLIGHPLESALLQLAAFGVVIVVASRSLSKRRPPGKEARADKTVSNEISPPVGLMYFLTAGMALQFLLSEASNVVQTIEPIPLDDQLELQRLLNPLSISDSLGLLVALVVVAPVTEEILFRGMLLPGLRSSYGHTVAWVGSSLLFGISHVRPAAMVPAFLGGMVLGWARVRTNSVLPSIFLHAGINALPLLLPSKIIAIRGFNTVGSNVYHVPMPIIGLSLLVFAIAIRLGVDLCYRPTST